MGVHVTSPVGPGMAGCQSSNWPSARFYRQSVDRRARKPVRHSRPVVVRAQMMGLAAAAVLFAVAVAVFAVVDAAAAAVSAACCWQPG